MPFCSSRIYTNITVEIVVKVNVTPPPAVTKSVMILTLPPPPIPGLQNDNEFQYSEDTNFKSKESSDTFHK